MFLKGKTQYWKNVNSHYIILNFEENEKFQQYFLGGAKDMEIHASRTIGRITLKFMKKQIDQKGKLKFYLNFIVITDDNAL